jgi:DNA-binding IclR family transcriptional regulator
VVAAVSVSGPIERVSRQPGRRYGEAVVRSAAAVEQAAGLGAAAS